MSEYSTAVAQHRHLIEVDAAVQGIKTATEGLVEARDIVAALEDQRPLKKRDAILRLIGTENPLTGKPHSASSAEAIVESDPAYAAHRLEQRRAEADVLFARANYEIALLKAKALVATEVA